MKTSLEHLPEYKQKEIHAIVNVICNAAKLEMVILFGSHATGNWKRDRYVENGVLYEYISDYDLLVILPHESKSNQFKIEKRVKEEIIDKNLIKTPISLIFHSMKEVNNGLREGNYFFSDIKKEGILLYDGGNYKLAEPKKLTPQEIKQKATKHFEQWYRSANEFLGQFETALNKQWYHNAAFQLHQATERLYVTILLVFTDYRAKQHNLEILGQQAETLDKRFKAAFHKTTEEEKRLFELLRKAYIDARYKMNQYHITKEELEYLATCVKRLQALTEEICKEKIEGLGNGEEK